MSDELMELPEGWEWSSVGSLSILMQYGTSAKTSKEPNGIPVLRMGNIVGGEVDFSSLKYLPKDHHEFPNLFLESGDILFNRTNSAELVGKTAVFNEQNSPCSFASYLIRIRLSQYHPELFSWYLNSIFGRAWIASVVSQQVGQANVSGAKLKGLKIPVPPLNEQKRIVAQIEALRERSQKAKAALDAIPELCDRFRQSVLAAAFRGDLTADWREENPNVEPASALLEKLLQSHELAGGHKKGNAAPPTDGVHTLKKSDFPETWEVIELKDLCKPGHPITYGILKPGPELENGVPYIRVADFPNDQLNLSTIRKTSFEIDRQFSRSRLEEGDVLLSIRGTVGRICRIPSSLIGANITQDSARLSIQESINVDYICLMLKAKSTQQRMVEATKGVAVRGINIGDVRVLQFPIPPYPEQVEIVRRITSFLQAITQVEWQYQWMTKGVLALNQSILAKAFRGELVEQDPNDEPASVLLDRIRAEREAQQPAKKTRGKVTERKKTE